MRRRDLLIAGPAAAFGLGILTTGCSGVSSGSGSARDWSPINPLRIPAELAPPVQAGRRRYPLRLQTGTAAFLPGKPVPTWGVNGAVLGPTLRMRTGDQVEPVVTNALPEDTTLHWHGMRLPATSDGGPHQMIMSGDTWRPGWRVINSASTSWYHPHPHGRTAMHVFRGIAGMIIIDDPNADALDVPHRYGIDDIPCIIQDRTILADGSVDFHTEPNFGQLGTDMLVNATMNAYLDVSSSLVRLRLLNGSNARLYHLGFSDERPFDLIANDAGLLAVPVGLTRVTLGPAERAEIVVELAPGDRVRLTTVAGDERIDRGSFPIMELRAADRLTASPRPPQELGGAPPITAEGGARVRHLKLQGHDAINGHGMDLTRIDEVVPAGAREIWEIENTVYSHNFHIHGVEFSLLDRSGSPAEPYEAGRKDTVHVPEKTTVRLAVAFADYTDPQTPYMYHCHILRHEDDGMMGQFVVVTPGTEADIDRTIPAMQHS